MGDDTDFHAEPVDPAALVRHAARDREPEAARSAVTVRTHAEAGCLLAGKAPPRSTSGIGQQTVGEVSVPRLVD
ncbi:hypothetical protein [Streptomyces sp. NPDC058701]|uniref:hypothetical protein n=1 Tax=Streptomyces sp. NPDC058701 TaxID=3346608 RepID=UPI00365265AE